MIKKFVSTLMLTFTLLFCLYLLTCSAAEIHSLIDFNFLKQGISMTSVYSTVGKPAETYDDHVNYIVENNLTLEIYKDSDDNLSYAALVSDEGVSMYLVFNWGNGPIGRSTALTGEDFNTLQEKEARTLKDLTYIRRGIKINTIISTSGEPDTFAGSGLRWPVYKLKNNNLLHIHSFTSERVVLISIQTDTASAYISFAKDSSTGSLFSPTDSNRLSEFLFVNDDTTMDDVYVKVGYPDKVTLLGATYDLSEHSSLIFNHFQSGQIKQVILKNNDENYIFIKLPIGVGIDSNGSFNSIYLEDEELNRAKENQIICKRKLEDFSLVEYGMNQNVVNEKFGEADFSLTNASCYMLHDGNVLLINYKNLLVDSVKLWTKSGEIISLDFNELNQLSIV